MKANIVGRRAVSPTNLSTDEASTLRRVAFGESDIRTLRRSDLDRLRTLGLVEPVGAGLRLTAAGAVLFKELPRSLFASAPRQHEGLPPR
jgi:predicted HTH transcriptional regulator